MGIKIMLPIIPCCILVLLLGCAKPVKTIGNEERNELLKIAYNEGKYSQCLKILKEGADGIVDLKPAYPMLYDIYKKYSTDREKTVEIEDLFEFFLENRKEAFACTMGSVYPLQTVGSYLAHIADLDFLKRIVAAGINVNSPYEKAHDSAIYEVSRKMKDIRVSSNVLENVNIYDDEKKERLELLLKANANVSMIDKNSETNIFHYFKWWPEGDDYEEILDIIISRGANILQRDTNGLSVLYYAIGHSALNQNTEAYIRYLVSRGVEVTDDDLAEFTSVWYNSLLKDDDDAIKLRRIHDFLAENVKVNTKVTDTDP